MNQDKLAILKSLVAVAWADGRMDDEERDVIEALLHAYEASEEEAKDVREFAASPKSLDDIPLGDLDPGDRRMLLQNAVMLTFIDGEQDEKEKALLTDLSERLEITGQEREQLLAIAAERAQRFVNLL